MKLIYKKESVLIAVTTLLSTILIINLFFKLRSLLPWRVNCWFCNNNFWIKFLDRNSWTCPKCDQYNGFTKDGDYNKTLITPNDQTLKTPKIFQSSPPKNGLCKTCNIKQRLKVTQLANFVPMNHNNFDEEIETYRVQLEKAYKLCSPCRKVVQLKLHKEKESLLGLKLLEIRSLGMKAQLLQKPRLLLKNVINNISMFIAGILIILISIDICIQILKNNNPMITNLKDIVYGLLERVVTIIKMKTEMTFPNIENYDLSEFILIDILPKNLNVRDFDYANDITQKVLGAIVGSIQIIGTISNINNLKYAIWIDLLWSAFVIASIAHPLYDIPPIGVGCVKFLSAVAVFYIYRIMKSNTGRLASQKIKCTPIKMKNLSSDTINSVIDNDDSSGMDSDDDVSLSKFGVRNFTDSSNETINSVNNNLMNGRTFTPRVVEGLWTKPKQNLTYCVNSVASKTPTIISDSVFVKPSFRKYQKLTKDDSDSELDESISTLCIGSPKKIKQSKNPIFSLRKFNGTPHFVAPTPLTRAKPVISPSKLGHSTSWVAGGYWEGERNLFSINGSRSSSQSSGFESQTSSMAHRNLFSQPPSREQSICGEPTPMVVDNVGNCNTSFVNSPTPQSFAHMSTPIYPQMQHNSYVHIPQARFPPQSTIANNVFARPQYAPSGVFRPPQLTGLIKLPQANSFASSH